MKQEVLCFFLTIVFYSVSAQKKIIGKQSDSTFSFVFMTDIHLKQDVEEKFQSVIDTVNKLSPDFVMTGGDLVFDVLRGNAAKSDSLFQLYTRMIKGFRMPVYNCIGNHELFGIYPESDIDSTHPDYKYGMFEKYLGETYYSFSYKGWHFMVLNSIDVNSKKQYIGIIDDKQRQWIKDDLSKIDSAMPVAIIMHIPLISAFQQRYPVKPIPVDAKDVIVSNRDEVLDLFKQHNLKLILQGHLHWVEDLYLDNKMHFITGGSVAGRPSWAGTRNGPRGFMLFKVRNEQISWTYIEYENKRQHSKLTIKQ